MSCYMVKFLPFIVLINMGCSNTGTKESPFTVNKNWQGIELLENGHPVFFYQREPKPAGATFLFNNYLHPLYDLSGDTLTEEFPEDHPHHRGIFWAWHQLYVHDQRIGDNWMMENISLVVDTLTTTLEEQARLDVRVLWKSAAIDNPFLEEHTSIIVHPRQSDIRKIDFEISLKSLVQGLQIGGSEDVKGYGGFCARIKLPKNLVFTSEGGSVTPMDGQVVAGAWMDFSAVYDTIHQGESGLALLCHPSTPNYPAPWILRQRGSMQNIVFPGEARMELSTEKPTVLRYRLIIHNGDAIKADITSLQSEYEQVTFNK